MRTKKRCTSRQFDKAVAGRQFTAERLMAARMVLVDGIPIAQAAVAAGRSRASVTQAVQLIFGEVTAMFSSANPERAARPGHSIVTVELPLLAVPGLIAGVVAAKGVVIQERQHGK
jgi:hypothetical protein